MKDILEEITRLRLDRNWSEYDMAKNAGIPQSTISTWYRKAQIPTIKSLERLCIGFGITMSQFFAEDCEAIPLTLEHRKMLDRWSRLTPKQRTLFLELFQAIR